MRYSGKLGISKQAEVRPGIWEEVVTEIDVLGTVTQRTETVVQGDQILPRAGTQTTVSVYVRGLGQLDNSDIRYVTYAGKNRVVTSDTTNYPQLVLYLGDEYHGPVPS